MDSESGALMKVAIWGVAFSIIVTALLATFAAGTGDYDYDVI